MLKIRLKRVGRKHDPSFRIVVTEASRSPKSSNYIEMLGAYDPRKDNPEVNAERVQYWIHSGAQVSDTVHNILVGKGVIEGKKKNVLPKKSPIVKETEQTPGEQKTGSTEASRDELNKDTPAETDVGSPAEAGDS